MPAEGRGAGAHLEVSELTVTYGPVLALEGVSLSVGPGSAVGLLGPNGAGKSTFLRAVSGLLRFHGGRIAHGDIRYDGEPVTRRDAAGRVSGGIAQVLEGRHVFADLSVEDNLRAGQLHRRRGAGAARARVLDLFPLLGQRLGQKAGLLSGGEQQMLAIGRALMSEPRLLLLDEPSLGLAPLVIRDIADALRSITAGGTTLVLVEQSSAMATRVTTRAHIIDSGRLRAEGPTADLLADQSVRAAYLGVQA